MKNRDSELQGKDKLLKARRRESQPTGLGDDELIVDDSVISSSDSEWQDIE